MNEVQITADIIIDEIKKLTKILGRPPKRDEWKSHFRHGGAIPNKFGGFTNLVRMALYEKKPMEIEEISSEVLDIDDIIAHKAKIYDRQHNYDEKLKGVSVKINMDGPYGICHFGDPHVDDNGTDIMALQHDMKIVNETKGMFAANVGDMSNNWTGRLAHLYADESVSAKEAWALVKWLINSCEWLYLIGGNHDLWSGASNPIKWMIKQQNCAYGPSRVRVCLKSPSTKRIINVNARHDFSGTSQWNPAHAVMKAASMGWHDEILICGHKHKSGYGVIKDPKTGVISHAIQVASYKRCDDFAAARNFPDQHLSCCVTTIINPEAKEENDLINVFLNLERAADYLNYLRKGYK